MSSPFRLPSGRKSVYHVSGTFCYLCLRSDTQRNIVSAPRRARPITRCHYSCTYFGLAFVERLQLRRRSFPGLMLAVIWKLRRGFVNFWRLGGRNRNGGCFQIATIRVLFRPSFPSVL